MASTGKQQSTIVFGGIDFLSVDAPRLHPASEQSGGVLQFGCGQPGWHQYLFQAVDQFAVDAAVVGVRGLLEVLVQVIRYVLDRQGCHEFTILVAIGLHPCLPESGRQAASRKGCFFLNRPAGGKHSSTGCG